jgi:GT2 family glycosyltransferase
LYPHFQGVTGTHELPDELEVDFIPGGASLIRREAYERVGLQDERLFMYLDELDWTYRAQRCGYKLVVAKRAQAWHQHTNVLDRRKWQERAYFYTLRNRVYLIRKYHGIWQMLRYCIIVTGHLLVRLMSSLIKVRKVDSQILSQILGMIFGLLGLMEIKLYVKRQS